MAYNLSTPVSPAHSTQQDEKGFENRPTPLALPAGSPIPPLKSTNRPYTNASSSLPEVEAEAQAKRLFQPRRETLGRRKLAYWIGRELGKAAAYPDQEQTPMPVQNTLPALSPQTQGIKGPKVVWPETKNIPLRPLTKLPPKPKPASGY